MFAVSSTGEVALRPKFMPTEYKNLGIKSMVELQRQLQFEKQAFANAGIAPSASIEARIPNAVDNDFLRITPKSKGTTLAAQLMMKPLLRPHNTTLRQFEYASASASTVRSAVGLGLIPSQFTSDSRFLGQLSQYLLDGYLPDANSPKESAYRDILQQLGGELWANTESILAGSYSRPTTTTGVINFPNAPGSDSPVLPPIYTTSPKDQLQDAVDRYNTTEGVVSPSTVGPSR